MTGKIQILVISYSHLLFILEIIFTLIYFSLWLMWIDSALEIFENIFNKKTKIIVFPLQLKIEFIKVNFHFVYENIDKIDSYT